MPNRSLPFRLTRCLTLWRCVSGAAEAVVHRVRAWINAALRGWTFLSTLCHSSMLTAVPNSQVGLFLFYSFLAFQHQGDVCCPFFFWGGHPFIHCRRPGRVRLSTPVRGRRTASGFVTDSRPCIWCSFGATFVHCPSNPATCRALWPTPALFISFWAVPV